MSEPQLLAVFSYSCLNLYNSTYANVRFLPVPATYEKLTIVWTYHIHYRLLSTFNMHSLFSWLSLVLPCYQPLGASVSYTPYCQPVTRANYNSKGLLTNRQVVHMHMRKTYVFWTLVQAQCSLKMFGHTFKSITYIAVSINLVEQREKLTGGMPKLARKCPVTDCYYSTAGQPFL